MTKGNLFFIAPENKSDWYKHGKFKRGIFYGKNNIWEQCFESWKDSSFDTKLLNDTTDVHDLLSDYFDEDFYDILLILPKIYRIDLCKYILLGKYGGGYSDIDMFLQTDFSHLINSKFIYINTRGNSLQNSLMFSSKDDLWFNIADKAKVEIIKHLEDIKDISYRFKNSRGLYPKSKHRTKIKDKYSKVVGRVVGAELMLEYFEENNITDRLIKFPENFFNNSFKNPFAYTKHYCTGFWKLPQKSL